MWTETCWISERPNNCWRSRCNCGCNQISSLTQRNEMCPRTGRKSHHDSIGFSPRPPWWQAFHTLDYWRLCCWWLCRLVWRRSVSITRWISCASRQWSGWTTTPLWLKPALWVESSASHVCFVCPPPPTHAPDEVFLYNVTHWVTVCVRLRRWQRPGPRSSSVIVLFRLYLLFYHFFINWQLLITIAGATTQSPKNGLTTGGWTNKLHCKAVGLSVCPPRLWRRVEADQLLHDLHHLPQGRTAFGVWTEPFYRCLVHLSVWILQFVHHSVDRQAAAALPH